MLNPGEIKIFAEANGFHAIGWFSASDFDGYLRTIEDRPEYHQFEYRHLAIFLKAGRIPQGIKTIVVLTMDYFIEDNQRSQGYKLSTTAGPAGQPLIPRSVPQLPSCARRGTVLRTSMYLIEPRLAEPGSDSSGRILYSTLMGWGPSWVLPQSA